MTVAFLYDSKPCKSRIPVPVRSKKLFFSLLEKVGIEKSVILCYQKYKPKSTKYSTGMHPNILAKAQFSE
jgi:hypothetical protein